MRQGRDLQDFPEFLFHPLIGSARSVSMFLDFAARTQQKARRAAGQVEGGRASGTDELLKG